MRIRLKELNRKRKRSENRHKATLQEEKKLVKAKAK